MKVNLSCLLYNNDNNKDSTVYFNDIWHDKVLYMRPKWSIIYIVFMIYTTIHANKRILFVLLWIPHWLLSDVEAFYFFFISTFFLWIHTLSTPSEIGLMRMMLDPTEEELIFGSDNVLVPSGELMLMYWGAIYVHISWNLFFIQHILNPIKRVFTIAAWC